MPDFSALQLSDLPEMLQLEQICFAYDAWSEPLLRVQLSDERRFTLGLRQPGIIAFACFSLLLDEAELLQVAVDPACRQQGLAAGLLQHSFELLAAQGIRRVLLEVRAGNQPARALYHRLNFVAEGTRKGYYAATLQQPAEDAVLMSLSFPE
ncbi:ribosomal protein S18-alanine N-acetyltransferase [Pontibacter sp. JAM-7]|uniref:ribosomal protein S18-alanine N-acetyltransferase n=1 Tax=Pontibacter sp. JAM-7 TaxID=3366581 RepID=UPI003AF62133